MHADQGGGPGAGHGASPSRALPWPQHRPHGPMTLLFLDRPGLPRSSSPGPGCGRKHDLEARGGLWEPSSLPTAPRPSGPCSEASAHSSQLASPFLLPAPCRAAQRLSLASPPSLSPGPSVGTRGEWGAAPPSLGHSQETRRAPSRAASGGGRGFRPGRCREGAGPKPFSGTLTDASGASERARPSECHGSLDEAVSGVS